MRNRLTEGISLTEIPAKWLIFSHMAASHLEIDLLRMLSAFLCLKQNGSWLWEGWKIPTELTWQTGPRKTPPNYRNETVVASIFYTYF